MYKPRTLESLDGISPEQYKSIVVGAMGLLSRGRGKIVTKALLISLHEEKEKWRNARLNDRVSDYDGLVDFLDTLNKINSGLIQERDLDTQIKERRLGQAMASTRTHLAAQTNYPPENNLYQWAVLAFKGFEGTSRSICEGLDEANPLDLRKRLLEKFQKEAKYEILTS